MTEQRQVFIAEDHLERLLAIERRAKELSNREPITQQQARESGLARFILTGAKH